MKHVSTLLISTGLLALTATAAQADNFPYWYVGLHGSLAWVSDADVTYGGANGGEISFENEYTLGAALGYRPYDSGTLFDAMRFELEYTFHNADLDDSTAPGGAVTSLDGDLKINSYMVNAYFDLNTDTALTPYIGGGLGIADAELSSSTSAIDDSDAQFAYQGMVGLTYSPESVPNTDWGVGYRYFGTSDMEFTDNGGTKLEHEYDSHNLEVNAKFHF